MEHRGKKKKNPYVKVKVAQSWPLFATPWTVAPQVFCPWDSPGKNTGVGSHSLLQGILPDPGIEPRPPALTGRFFIPEPPGKAEISPGRG